MNYLPIASYIKMNLVSLNLSYKALVWLVSFKIIAFFFPNPTVWGKFKDVQGLPFKKKSIISSNLVTFGMGRSDLFKFCITLYKVTNTRVPSLTYHVLHYICRFLLLLFGFIMKRLTIFKSWKLVIYAIIFGPKLHY